MKYHGMMSKLSHICVSS